ncbi:MAG: bifunctional folylpolyglutamate synthase/dihydrofolate synthase [Kiritimatiellia bacterium]
MDQLDAISSILDRHAKAGIELGLDRILAVLQALDNPHLGLAAIHIAGTNGKGSVAAICETAFRVAGYPVGRYTSPHLLQVNERILLNGEPITDSELAACLELADRAPDAEKLSYFEILTVAAFLAFRRAGIKLVVLETGLGGRLDATNVVTPLVSAITHIALDHCSILGSSLSEIAREKAGIIKENRPVVTAPQAPEVLAVLEETARSRGSHLVQAEEYVTVESSRRYLYGQLLKVSFPDGDLPRVQCRLGGAYQLQNIATAFAALKFSGLELPDSAYAESLRTVVWPARYQLIEEEPPMILDSAHNPDGMAALRESLHLQQFRGPIGLVVGMCADKDVAESVRTIEPAGDRVWTVPVRNPRSIAPQALCAHFRKIPAQAIDTLPVALDLARTWAELNNGLLVVAGSIFLAGELLQATGTYPYPQSGRLDPNERIKPL